MKTIQVILTKLSMLQGFDFDLWSLNIINRDHVLNVPNLHTNYENNSSYFG